MGGVVKKVSESDMTAWVLLSLSTLNKRGNDLAENLVV